MNKNAKRFLRVSVAVLLLAGVGAGGYFLWKNRTPEPVKTVFASNYSLDYMASNITLNGMVNSDAAQRIVKEKDLTVETYYVKKGDVVHVGDKLLKYDATLESIDAELKRSELLQLEYDLMGYYAEYKKYAKKEWEDPLVTELTPVETTAPTPVVRNMRPLPRLAPVRSTSITMPNVCGMTAAEIYNYLKNAGTAPDNTLMVNVFCKDGYELNWTFVNKLDTRTALAVGQRELTDPDTEDSSDFFTRTPGKGIPGILSVNGISTAFVKDCVEKKEARKPEGYTKEFAFKFTDPDVQPPYESAVSVVLNVYNISPTPTPTGPVAPTPTPYIPGPSREERLEMAKEAARKIREAELQYLQLQLDLKNYRKSGKDGYIYATVDGVVTTLEDPKDVGEGETLLLVKGNGSFYVRGQVNEYLLGRVVPGTRFSGMSYETGASFTGTVTEVASMPDDSSQSYDNNDASLYGVRVTIDDPEGLEVGSWCEMTLVEDESPTAVKKTNLYLMEAFIANENGEQCIYIGRDGKLVREVVRTGKNFFGYWELLGSSLTMGDRIAFPGGKGVADGAPCVMDEE
ncbi:MAG: hypothetical protein Q4C53_03835 [Clostridia bacterium]|nr:hypothetical protein [Clostridia bacterium]